jgi:hypothetical protein
MLNAIPTDMKKDRKSWVYLLFLNQKKINMINKIAARIIINIKESKVIQNDGPEPLVYGN